MKKILLVHDAELFLRMEQTILRRKDYQIYTARTGEEAIRLAEEKRPDLVIVDDGLRSPLASQLCRKLRNNPRTISCSILISISRGNRPALHKYLQAGANDYVVKPVNRLLFNQRVTNLLHISSRRFLRTLVKAQVQGRQQECSFFGSTVNLSESGLLVETRRPLEKGEEIALQFFLPGDLDPMRIKAVVVRTAEEMPLCANSYGLTFSEISWEDRERIRRFIDRQIEDEEQGNRDADDAVGPQAVGTAS